MRLYSIASSRYGDRHDGKTCTLCVVRVVWRGEHAVPFGASMLCIVCGQVGRQQVSEATVRQQATQQRFSSQQLLQDSAAPTCHWLLCR